MSLPTYEETTEKLKKLGVRRGAWGCVTTYHVESHTQFDALKEHIIVGCADVTRFPDFTEVNRYPEVNGHYFGPGWYIAKRIPLPTYDSHEVLRFDYTIELLTPTIEEKEWW